MLIFERLGFRSGNIQLVRMLLEKHADVNAKDSENRTPLHLAIDKGYTDIVLALLEKKPNLEQKNKVIFLNV